MFLLKRKTLLSVFVLIILFAYLSVTAFAAIRYSILINGSPVKGEAKVIDGVTYVPMRTVVEKLGGTYHVMPDLNRISIIGKDKSMFGGHTKTNPLDTGSKAFIAINKGNDKFICEISVVGMSTGSESWKQFSQLNGPAPKGYSFYFVKINYKVLSVEEPGTEVHLNFYDFNYLDSKTQELIPSIPLLMNNYKLKVGETFNDWIGFLIKEDFQLDTITYSKNGDQTDALWIKV
ncbi:hypothetical protein [Cohnella abietis]|uniref:Copper amine oxidase-like N-terminal domain-containing protein n=1 Tax=Cohnella abietis TaxID=2507935 RepID=A0A3T1CY15_9BACL|nr:hypothetical protein [Cohnella abietis]BBI30724.1 hypothetical protein KCTCHS21_01230 [Cohnella abietis]